MRSTPPCRIADRHGLEASVDRWKQIRDEIHREVCERGYDSERAAREIPRPGRPRSE